MLLIFEHLEKPEKPINLTQRKRYLMLDLMIIHKASLLSEDSIDHVGMWL